MPMVIKRDEPGKNPKAGGSTAKAAPSAAPKSTPKPAPKAATTAKAKKKGAKDAGSDTPKLIGLGAVIVLAVGFMLWYFVFSGSPEPTTVPTNNTDRPPVAATTPGGGTGGTTAPPKLGGFSTGEEAPASGSRGLGRGTEGDLGGKEGID
jgi:hypothetical protein